MLRTLENTRDDLEVSRISTPIFVLENALSINDINAIRFRHSPHAFRSFATL